MRKRWESHSAIVLTFFLLASSLCVMASDQNELKQIQQAIQAKGAQWTAGVNWISQLSREEQRRLCGTILEKPDPSQVSLLTLPFIAGLPAKFDWRNNNGNWITTVTNQLSCGSCWDFSAAAQVEAWWKIYFNQLDSMIDLSEQYVLSCSEGSCEGWNVGDALKFIKNTGVPTENCLPYKADDTIPCTAACLDWQAQAVKIPGWSYITLDEPIVDNIKNAVYQHPLSASFTVYEDFFSYSSGVCEHVWENVEGGHALLIVGWNDEEKSWLWKSIQKSNKY